MHDFTPKRSIRGDRRSPRDRRVEVDRRLTERRFAMVLVELERRIRPVSRRAGQRRKADSERRRGADRRRRIQPLTD